MHRHDRNKCVFTEKTEEDEHKEVRIKMKRSERRNITLTMTAGDNWDKKNSNGEEGGKNFDNQ